MSRYECSPPRNPKNSSKPRDIGMKLLACAEMPLAEDSSPVASRPQPIRKSRFAQRQPELAPGAEVEFMSEPLWVAPGQQAGARRAAIRTGDIRIGEADSILASASMFGVGMSLLP